jgi:hypothetical protein
LKRDLKQLWFITKEKNQGEQMDLWNFMDRIAQEKKTGMREINVYIVFKSITTENGTDIYSSSSAADFFDLN